jgi:hypothetical protein
MALYVHVPREGKEMGRTIRKELYHTDARSGVNKLQSKL